jgi:hypothetical protein
MKLWHVATGVVLIFVCIWAANNVKFVTNIVG